MLSYILATIIGLGSVAFYMAAFVFPEVYRKGDFIWSGVGFFYALVLWFCAGQIGGAVLLGQTASVALVAWLGWQTLKLRRETTPLTEQTSTAAIEAAGISPTAIAEKITTVFKPGKKVTPPMTPTPVPEVASNTAEIVTDAVTEALLTTTEEIIDDHFQPSPAPVPEGMVASPSIEITQETPEVISSVLPEPEEQLEVIPPPSVIPEFPESTPISTTEDDLGEDELEDDLDPVGSAPAPLPPLPTPSLQPKSRTFGVLASLVDRVKGLLGKGKPQAPTPIQTTPSSIAKPDEEMDSLEVEMVEESPILVEVADVPEVEAVESPEAIEVEDSSEVESLEVEDSPEAESLEVEDSSEKDIVEVGVSQAVDATESPKEIEVSESSEEEITVEIVVSDPVETVESFEMRDVSGASSEDETIEETISQASQAIVPEENSPDAAISPETETADVEEETPSLDETLPTLNKPKPRPKQP